VTVSLEALRLALADNLSTLDGVQVSPYLLANPTPPAIMIYPGEITWDLAARRGLDMWRFTVQAIVGSNTDQGAQMLLDQLLDPNGTNSLKTAIETADTGSLTYLGGIAGDVSAISTTGYKVYIREQGGPVLGAEWTVQVLAAGN